MFIKKWAIIGVFVFGVFIGYLLKNIASSINEFGELSKGTGSSMLMHNDIGYIAEFGYIPNKETALKVAKAVWLPIYGKSDLRAQIYYVRLIDDIWYIEGAKKRLKNLFFHSYGGGPFIKIDKKTGSILYVGHTG